MDEQLKNIWNFVDKSHEEMINLWKNSRRWFDASYSTMVGVPALCGMGVQGKYQHTNKEYGHLESLFERTKLLASTILEL